jgi:hypothetical protein
MEPPAPRLRPPRLGAVPGQGVAKPTSGAVPGQGAATPELGKVSHRAVRPSSSSSSSLTPLLSRVGEQEEEPNSSIWEDS